MKQYNQKIDHSDEEKLYKQRKLSSDTQSSFHSPQIGPESMSSSDSYHLKSNFNQLNLQDSYSNDGNIQQQQQQQQQNYLNIPQSLTVSQSQALMQQILQNKNKLTSLDDLKERAISPIQKQQQKVLIPNQQSLINSTPLFNNSYKKSKKNSCNTNQNESTRNSSKDSGIQQKNNNNINNSTNKANLNSKRSHVDSFQNMYKMFMPQIYGLPFNFSQFQNFDFTQQNNNNEVEDIPTATNNSNIINNLIGNFSQQLFNHNTFSQNNNFFEDFCNQKQQQQQQQQTAQQKKNIIIQQKNDDLMENETNFSNIQEEQEEEDKISQQIKQKQSFQNQIQHFQSFKEEVNRKQKEFFEKNTSGTSEQFKEYLQKNINFSIPSKNGEAPEFEFNLSSSNFQNNSLSSLSNSSVDFNQLSLSNVSGPQMVGNLTKEERREKVNNYLEKKKNRQWKNIRYRVRQNLADNRQRNQGRFIKSNTSRFNFDIYNKSLVKDLNKHIQQSNENQKIMENQSCPPDMFQQKKQKK